MSRNLLKSFILTII